MSIDEEDELAQLRRRAYSPAADISGDPDALRRLIELEQRATAAEEGPAPASVAAVVEEPGDEPADEDAPDAAPERARPERPRPRGSRLLVIGAVALIAVTALTTVLLTQRSQADPLRAGVEEVARLTPDPAYEAPSVLYRGVTGRVTAYGAFEGFRVISYPSFRDGDEVPRCMTIWQPDLLEVQGTGLSYGGGEALVPSCGAGAFPATYTILLTDGSAERALTDLPPDTALQFVYDEEQDQIVVSRG